MITKNDHLPKALCAQDISYQVGDRLLIKEISLTLAGGEMVAIIGPNGAGKSTLMRLLTGYLSPQQGNCTLLGKKLADYSPRQLARLRAVMRQHNTMMFPFEAQEVIAMGRAPYSPGDLHHQQAIQQVMANTGCHLLATRHYHALSGGEQQRVQLARALAQLWQPQSESRWLFLDEPTSALDLYHQQQILRLLKKLTQCGSLSVCCILHDLNLAALYADRILLLHQGQLVAQGTPQEVLNRDILSHWYQADLEVRGHPESGTPQIFLRH